MKEKKMEWINVSHEDYTLEEVEDESLITIHNLKPERKYSARLLTKSTVDDCFTVMTSDDQILIKGYLRMFLISNGYRQKHLKHFIIFDYFIDFKSLVKDKQFVNQKSLFSAFFTVQ